MAGLFLFLTFNMHSRTPIFSYHHVLWADAAGYYSYLPATFEFGWKAEHFPDSVDILTGEGFQLNSETNSIETKYTYGVALLQLPFYLTGRLITKINGSNENGFGIIGHRMIMIAGVFYSLAALYFLKRIMKKMYGAFSASMAVLFLFSSTTLFYYGIDKAGFSHVYLFFLFTVLINMVNRLVYSPNFFRSLLFFAILLLCFLIRPTSVFAFPLIFLTGIKSKADLFELLHALRKNSNSYLLPACLATLVLIPQFTYWYFVSGNIFWYSYGDEGFSNLTNPYLLELWFSPNNGLFVYTPIVAVLLVISLLKFNRGIDSISFLVVFLFISWMFASWHDWRFGCSFGSRSFTEYLVFLAFPLAGLLNHLKEGRYHKLLLFCCVMIGYIAFVNINTIYTYDDCFYGDTWDYENFFKIIRFY
ncbi:MAG: hypothetical protein ACK40M_13120 [Flavobacteriales bacterium]